eukprot:Phypoly_transcript_12599.p1 GENE.Phypoly_transcript_12599~~Phypoly_transcript_12599.p1  ORF type:complete len:102 (+),score=5.93 Phypoly_transcript_12599:436-741(+)
MECLEYLLKHGADLDIHKNYVGPIGVNPVFLEVKDPRMGHFLLDLGIDPNVVNDESKNICMVLVDRQDLAFLNTRTSDFFPFFDRLLKLGHISPCYLFVWG